MIEDFFLLESLSGVACVIYVVLLVRDCIQHIIFEFEYVLMCMQASEAEKKYRKVGVAKAVHVEENHWFHSFQSRDASRCTSLSRSLTL